MKKRILEPGREVRHNMLLGYTSQHDIGRCVTLDIGRYVTERYWEIRHIRYWEIRHRTILGMYYKTILVNSPRRNIGRYVRAHCWGIRHIMLEDTSQHNIWQCVIVSQLDDGRYLTAGHEWEVHHCIILRDTTRTSWNDTGRYSTRIWEMLHDNTQIHVTARYCLLNGVSCVFRCLHCLGFFSKKKRKKKRKKG